jgi:Protein of unknown function (DUF2012)
MMLQVVFLLFSCLAFSQGLDIKGSITPNAYLLSPALLPPSTLVILSAPNHEYSTHPSPGGAFSFYNVTAESSYLLQIECLTHKFPPLRIDVEDESVEVYQTFQENEWSHRGARLAYPIQIAATAQADYYMV